jgi:hypothetical protein
MRSRKINSLAESADGGPDALVGIGDHQLDAAQPVALERVRRKLAGVDDGNRQMVDILNTVLTDGLSAAETACAEALGHGVHSADVVLNILARRVSPLLRSTS